MRRGEAAPIEKTMSLSRLEFEKSLAALSGGAGDVVMGADGVRLPCGAGHVEVTFEPLPAVRLGGLLELPRAKVSIVFSGAAAEEREVFLRRFEIAFQRGGG